MRAITGSYDAAFCWGNSFGYMPHAETKQFLATLARVLKPGASFVLQTGAVAESLLPHLKREAMFHIGEIDFRIRNTYVVETSVLQTEYSFTKNGKTESKLGWQSVYTSGELCRMFAEAGLNAVHLHQNIEGQPFELGSESTPHTHLILTVQRAG